MDAIVAGVPCNFKRALAAGRACKHRAFNWRASRLDGHFNSYGGGGNGSAVSYEENDGEAS